MNIVNADNKFDEEIKNFKGKCIVDFWAPWCGPCKMFGPIFEETSKQYNKEKFCKINVDEDNTTPKEFGIMSIPTIIMFENGKEIKRKIGFMDKNELINFIEK